ncbi:hypothetical protein AGRA3207_002170 [Actinomadura graeca]|uniref:Uncharacterized protein n=1 Tax=Actinomadura graeca TaxID=2750812 RepID=A0ABX8QRN3_9ACTN|nr:hypothetical protein [Actinomadura graeca]QXJ21330.1 hypothetical protein AGRA3207_002170 [Actinomadura graeca]
MPARQDGGALQGGAPRVVWFASETDPRTVSGRSVAADLVKEERPSHLVWHPGTGEILQLLPATRAARLLGDHVGREGRACLQIAVVGQARVPFTGMLLNGLDQIVRWLDAWGIDRRWPAGPPLPSPQSYHSLRARKDWARGGHFGASQVPVVDRPDPGAIDIRRITGPDTPVAPIPKPRVPIPEPATVTRLAARGTRAGDAAHTPQGQRPAQATGHSSPGPDRPPLASRSSVMSG